MKRKWIVAAILAILVVGGFYLYTHAGNAITRATERIASDALGVPVKINHIQLALMDKKVTVQGIAIGNPPGFKNPNAITADSVDVTLKAASSQLIDFQNITVKGSVVNFEVNENGVNVLVLKDLANRKEQKQKTANQTVKVVIDHMLIDATTINPSVSVLSSKIATINMPPLNLSGIGQGKSVTAGDAIVQILDQYLALVAKQASGAGILKHMPTSDDISHGAEDTAKSIGKLF